MSKSNFTENLGSVMVVKKRSFFYWFVKNAWKSVRHISIFAMCDKLLEILWRMEYLRSTTFYTFPIIQMPEGHRRIKYLLYCWAIHVAANNKIRGSSSKMLRVFVRF